DFLALKNTLNQFITHIRFFEFSTKDFNDKVRPFKKLLPKTLFEDIVTFYMINVHQSMPPPRNGRIDVDSTIIRSKHASILTNWILRKDVKTKIPKNNKYNFNLIYRGSRDGFDVQIMRKKCNGQGAYFLIIKINENDAIIGGYNPLKHQQIYTYNIGKGYWANTTESFIFSIDKKDWKISRVANADHASYEPFNTFDHALNFGYSDLVINGDAGTCNQKYYESKILDSEKFTIKEMEIFTFKVE
ncbi:13312_t:CDS:1, partial [Funneliformis geosporum]